MDKAAAWVEFFERLRSLTDEMTPQQRGLQFEALLWQLLKSESLDPRKSYRTLGEQIDGSFVIDGRTFLLEAKWTREGIPASTLYEFRGKVDGKLVGTIGVFISVGGFSPDAVNALIAGKTLNLILFDGDDMDRIGTRQVTFCEALALKLRAAAEQGTPFAPLADGLTASHPVDDTPPDPKQPETRRVIVVEGQSDVWLLSALLRSAAEEFDDVQFLVAFGRLNVPKIGALFAAKFEGVISAFVMAVDGDGRSRAEVQEELLRMAPDSGLDIANSTVVFEPEIEGAFGLPRDWRREYLRQGDAALPSPTEIWRRVREVDSLRSFAEKLQATPGPEVFLD